MKHALLCGLLSGALASAQSQPTAPLPAPAAQAPLDHSGVAWTLPFATALARAKAEHRLLFVPVIAGGTDNTGCW